MHHLNVDQYLERIGFSGLLSVDYECLRQLHKCHVMTVPFEALDVRIGKKIGLQIGPVFDKVVISRRGGYCYELNHLFHSLLTAIGFENHLISARVFDNETYGPAFDHMAIVVNLPEPLLVDVGFGDLFIEPIKIQLDIRQEDSFKSYKIVKSDEVYFVLSESLKAASDFKVKYQFDISARAVGQFAQQNKFKQSSPQSHFVQNRICTLPTKMGRKTILNNTFKVREGNKVEKKDIKSHEELIRILDVEFGLTLNCAGYKNP